MTEYGITESAIISLDNAKSVIEDYKFSVCEDNKVFYTDEPTHLTISNEVNSISINKKRIEEIRHEDILTPDGVETEHVLFFLSDGVSLSVSKDGAILNKELDFDVYIKGV